MGRPASPAPRIDALRQPKRPSTIAAAMCTNLQFTCREEVSYRGLVEDSSQARSLLCQLLDSVGYRYQLETDGLPRATFAQHVPDGPPVRVEASIAVQELRLWAQDIGRPSPLSPARCVEITEEWSFGRAFLVDEGLDASVSMYLGGPVPGPVALRHTLMHLLESMSLLRRGLVPYYAPPEPAAPIELAAVAEHLRAMDVGFTPRSDLLTAKLGDPNGSDAYIGFYLWDGTFLNARAERGPNANLVDPIEALPRLHQLNAQLSYGSVNVNPQGKLSFLMGMPLSWSPLDQAMLHWCISKAMFVLRALDEQFSPVS
ncbi:MAG: hypothetical protein AAGA56_13095 [Myxococcota bacterium]